MKQLPDPKQSGNRLPFDGDANSLSFHFWKGVSEIRLEFLANPDNRMSTLTHEADEVVDRLDESLFRGRCPFRKKIIHHVNDDEDWSLHHRRKYPGTVSPSNRRS